MDALLASGTDYQGSSDFWLFVVYCLVVIVVVLFFFFYYNRVIALLITWLINQYTWRQFNAYIEVDSIRFTVLGARILFKNLRYISTNQSISIVKGHVTIRYWLMSVRKTGQDKKTENNSKLPCRIVCSLEGLEVFMYNNVPVYEGLKDVLGINPLERLNTAKQTPTMQELQSSIDPESHDQVGFETSLFQRLVPIEFECTTGAVMIGNAELQTMLVCQVAQASGIVSTAPSRTTMDHFKTITDLVLGKLQVHVKENMDFSKVNVVPETSDTNRLCRMLLHPLRWFIPSSKARQYGGMQHIHTLMNSQKRETPVNNPGGTTYHQEYGKVSNMIECSKMAITYYSDSPGLVPSTLPPPPLINSNDVHFGNGGLPPEWGVRISVWTAMIHYGPWTDRQRSVIQDYFFPSSYRNNVPTPHLLPGQQRAAASFDFHLEFMTEATLRFPTRERSKAYTYKYHHHNNNIIDWKYDEDSDDLDIGADGYYTRPYGWLDIKAGADSSVKLIIPYVLGQQGCASTLDINLKDVDVSTSINYASFLQASNFEMKLLMNSPLEWNAHRVWEIKAYTNRPRIFLLRDHIFLFQDMLKDLSSEPLSDILYFIPTTYKFHLDINDPFIYLCVNEHNIISNPNAIDDNTFIKINSRKVRFNATLPFTMFEPEVSSIQFDLEIEQFRTGISLQTSHTLNAFLEEDNAQFGVGVHLRLDGSYEYYNSVDVARHIESLNLDIKLDGITVKLFGTVIRYLVILKENYFGRWVNFSTIEEYRQRRVKPEQWKEIRKKQADSKPIQDPLEVYILLKVQDGAFILPENLYDCTQYSQMEFQELQLELRNLDIYMDTHVNFSPITWTRDSNPSPNTKSGPFRMKNGRDPRNHVYIDEMNIHGHLMYGPLPEIATYLGRWNFDIGRVMGELKPSFLLGTTCFAQTFIYNLIDEDNAVPAAPEDADMVSLPDVTFVKATVKEIDVYLMSHSGATEIYLKDGITAEFDNWINKKYSQRINLQLPSIQTICLANQEQSSLGLAQENEFSWVEVAKLEVGLNITIFRQTKNWRKERSEQQTFIRTQDNPTRRCFHLYDTDNVSQNSRVSTRMSQEYHVGVLYAPPFRSFYLDNEGVVEPCDAESNLTRSTSNPESSYHYAKGSSVPSASSYGDNYSDSDVESCVYEPDARSSKHRHSAQSGISRDDDSFHTAISYSQYPDSQTHFDMDFDLDYASDGYEDASNESAGEIDSEEEEIQIKRRSFEYHASKNSTAEASIPPSIPYSGYLKRYRVKRATSSNHGHSFFHPYLPPPRTSFIPQNDNEDSRGRGLNFDTGEKMDSTFADFEDDGQEPQEDNDNDNRKENETTATTIIEATSPVTILLTPIFVKIAQELTEAINKDDWDLETMLDSLQIEYIAQLTRYLTDQFICSRVAILMPRTYLHFIQDVMIPDDLPVYKHGQSHINTKYDQEDALLCSADIVLEKLYMICSFKFQDFAYDEKQKSVAESKLVLQESRVHIDIGKLDCKVRYISGRRESSRPILFGIPHNWQRKHQYSPQNESSEDDLINELIVIDFVLNNLGLKWLGATKPNYLNLAIGNISAVIITESAEILSGAVYSWLVFVNDLKSIMSSFQDRRSRQIQVFIHEIANFSTRTHVKSDPLFLTKPTNILRLGSRNFRNDVGWKLLARMRHCLRSMPSSERERLQYRLTSGGAIENVDSRDMFVNVVTTFSRWRNWEIGSNAVSHCRLLTQPFKQKVKNFEITESKTDPVVEFLISSVNLAKIKVERLEFYIYEEEKEQDHNSLVIGPFDFVLESMYKQSSVVETVVDGTTKKILSVKDGYLDLVAKASIGSINITANPVLLAFAKHMLMVQRMFTGKLRSLSHASSYPILERNNTAHLTYGDSGLLSEDGPDSFSLHNIMAKVDILAQVLVSVDEIDICAMAQKLRMQSFIKALQSSALFSNPKLTTLSLLASSEKADSDTGSGIRSSNKASRRNLGGLSNRIIFEAGGGLDVIDIRVYDMARHSHPLANKLLVIILDGVNLNANMSQSPRISKRHVRTENSKQVLNVFSNIHKFHVHAPQSLLKLYGFVEDWRTEQGKTYHFMYQNLLKEWEEQRKFDSSPLQPTKAPGPKYDIKLQFLLNQFVARSDLLPSLSIEYNIEDFFVMVHELQQKGAPLRKYAFQISKQTLHIITKSPPPHTATLAGSEDYAGGIFSIPGIRSNGSIYSELQDSGEYKLILRSKISIDFISLPLNVGMIDSLLTAHSLLGNEIGELLEVLSYSKQRREANNVVDTELTGKHDKELTYCIEICLDGLRVAATSPSAVGIFESNMLEAKLSSGPSSESNASPVWKIQGHDFALSLDHNSGVGVEDKPRSKEEEKYQRNRLAYIMIDFDVSNYNPEDPLQTECKANDDHVMNNLESYHINFPKIQTVMQPIALGKLAEMYIYYETELKKRKEMKKMDLERLANNTKLLVQSFKSDTPVKEDEEQSLLRGKRLSIYLQRLGVAIPLENSDSSTKYKPREINALLFSITSLRLDTQNIEKCEVGLENISLQFVNKFDQNKEEHFMAENHPRMNRMLLPSISCNLYTRSEKPRQFVTIDARVCGFEVDIDGTITDYINTLGAIYVKSMDRVDAFSAKTSMDLSPENTPIVKQEVTELIYVDIKGKIEYLSGILRLYPKRHSGDNKRKKDVSKSLRSKPETLYYGRATETNMVTIKLPGISAWFTYQTPLGSLSSVSGMPKRFHGDILVHESDNTLHPSLVQFLHEVVAGLKLGIQQSSEQVVKEGSDSIGYGVNASLLLRLSRSKLDLSCQPFSKVVCSLGWEKGEFLMNSFSTGTSSRTMSCLGYISDISVIVKHNFSPEACLTAAVDRVLLNAMLGSQRGEEAEKDDISIIVDVESIVADVNIRYLNDLLNINTFWFAPSQFTDDIRNSELSIQNKENPEVLQENYTTVNPLPFARRVAAHFQSIQLSVDMGQAIGRIALKPKNLTINTYNLPFKSKGLDAYIDEVYISSEGRLSGEALVSPISIKLVVDLLNPSKPERTCNATSFLLMQGARAKFEYEYQNILDLIQGTVKFQSNAVKSNDSYLLSIGIDMKPLLARLSIKTVPIIVTMYSKFNELLKKKKAEASIQDMPLAFKKPESAEKKSVQKDVDNISKAHQNKIMLARTTVELVCHSIGIIIYPSQFQDTDNVEISAQMIKVLLERTPLTDEQGQSSIHRKLVLSLTSAALLKNVPGKDIMDHHIEYLKTLSRATGTLQDNPIAMPAKSGTNIVGIPSTTLTMDSNQVHRLVEHVFAAKFGGRISVSLNLGLMRYLQEMHTMFTSQLNRALEPEFNTLPQTPISETLNPSNMLHQSEDTNSVDSGVGVSAQIGLAMTSETLSAKERPAKVLSKDAISGSSSAFVVHKDELLDEVQDNSEEKLEYKSKVPVNFYPQLQVMADATPPVEWLGLKRETLPALIHENLTLNLEKISQGLWAMYADHTV